VDGGPQAGVAGDVHLATKRVGALLDAHQAKAAAAPAYRLEVEARAIVGDVELDHVAESAQRDDQPPRRPMNEPVAKRLLSDAKQAYGDALIDRAEVALIDEAHINAVALPHLYAVALYCRREAQQSECRWMQIM
jgi:hypothetical protein